MPLQGRVEKGIIVFDEPHTLPDGTRVHIEPLKDSSQSQAATYNEHEMVRVVMDLEQEGFRLRRGAVGTIVGVYQGGKGYAVEFDDLPGGSEVVTLYPQQIEPAS